MNLYAESSAVLAWLLGESEGERVRKSLAAAKIVLSSDLTLIECDRVLIRAVSRRDIKEAAAADRRAIMANAAANWTLLRLHADVTQRARRPFPAEPVRTLDALHLASALEARAAVGGLFFLSLDRVLRANALELGFDLLPA